MTGVNEIAAGDVRDWRGWPAQGLSGPGNPNLRSLVAIILPWESRGPFLCLVPPLIQTGGQCSSKKGGTKRSSEPDFPTRSCAKWRNPEVVLPMQKDSVAFCHLP